MLNKIKVFCFTVFLLTLSAAYSQANITLQDINADSNDFGNLNQSSVFSGDGLPGDFEVLMCATTSNGANSFLDPTPGSWSTLDSDNCGGGGCIQGIFTRFDESSGGTDVFCNWTVTTDVFGGGAFRYSGVDRDNPVIDFDCNTGAGSVVTAPSIFTEANSVVIRVFTRVEFLQEQINQGAQVLQGSFVAFAITGGESVLINGRSFEFEEEGPTGTAENEFITSGDWRACTIALRMGSTNIPTLSEWGLLASAAGLMLIGVFFAVKRRRAFNF